VQTLIFIVFTSPVHPAATRIDSGYSRLGLRKAVNLLTSGWAYAKHGYKRRGIHTARLWPARPTQD